MLKKIAVGQVRLGMHLHKLEGPWLAHPFWKTQFVIDRAQDLQRLHGSGVTQCWIDPALGIDVPVPAANPAALPACSRMASWQGHFDATLFAAFVQSLGIYPVGSLVRLQSGRLAVVVEQNAHKLVAPVVKVFFSTRSQMPIAVLRVDLAASGCHDRITGREARVEGRFERLDDLWVDPELLRKR